MPVISRATQTEPADRLAAIQLRLKELKSALPEYTDLTANRVVKFLPKPIPERKRLHSKKERSTIFIGPNLTRVDRAAYQRINWDCYSLATRALLDAVFDKQTLATRNISGIKLGSMGRMRSTDYILDPLKVSDIVQLVQHKCKVSETVIRKIISIKCSDTANTKRFKNII
ncbi:protein insensitive-like [Drosophila novamexicana]|uniref:protein insensitive-like n=1 Tax=Drosophila novamexicana TaxID=47314 RepID=UPI0011E58B75|nr:protein insensitive-like [Drosophila novamexicana]